VRYKDFPFIQKIPSYLLPLALRARQDCQERIFFKGLPQQASTETDLSFLFLRPPRELFLPSRAKECIITHCIHPTCLLPASMHPGTGRCSPTEGKHCQIRALTYQESNDFVGPVIARNKNTYIFIMRLPSAESEKIEQQERVQG
jgi:hypothetical protein